MSTERLHEYLSNAVAFGFQGAVLVGKQGEILLNEGYGLANREQNIPNTSQTAFDTGSINKSFTAIAIMQLMEQGKLSVEQTLPNFFKDVPNDKREISLFHLLTHSSGLFDYHAQTDFDRMSRDEAEHLIIQEGAMEHAINSTYQYSNAGYILLAMIVEIVSEMPYRDYMRQNVFAPAGMHHTGWYGEGIWNAEDVAHGYMDTEHHGSPYKWAEPQWALLGSGGLVQPLSDLFHAHEALKHNILLKEETQAQMYTPHLNDALGWHVENNTPYGKLINHNGASGYGFSATFCRFVDEDVVIAIASNAVVSGEFMAIMLQDTITQFAFGEALPIPPKVQARQITGENYVGQYHVAKGDSIQVIAETDSLQIIPESITAADYFFPQDDYDIHDTMQIIAQEMNDKKYTTLQGKLANPDTLHRYPDLINQFTEEHGTFLQSDYIGKTYLKDYLIGHIRLQFERGKRVLRFAWHDEQIIGRIPIYEDIDPLHTFTAYPVDESHFAGFNLFTGVAFELQFDGNRLSVTTENKSVTLEKKM